MHYVMTCEGIEPATTIGKAPRLPRGPWNKGRLISYEVKQPLVYSLDRAYPGEFRPMYPSAAPLMREDLLAALSEAGVDNLQLFDAIIKDPWKKTDLTNYKAVNVVGVVAGADLGQSTMMGTTDSTLIDADFDSLVLDEEKIQGLLLFRLAESVSAIVVDERVKRTIEARGVPGMTFYEPGEWSG